jgi:hypothetical protein
VVIRKEARYMDAFVADFRRADKDARLQLCRVWVGSEDEAKAVADALAQSDIAQRAAELRQVYGRMEQLMSLSKDEMVKIHKKQLQSNPLAKAVLSYFPGARDAEKTQECRQLLLKAAIDVVLRGKDALADYRDPFGDGPFQHKPTDGGFELRSKKYLGEKQWLSLRVGVTR